MRKTTTICLLLFCVWLGGQNAGLASATYTNLTSTEQGIVSQIDGTGIYNYDLELERIALNHTLSGYSYRSSGSPGANETAEWIKEQFESFDLETRKEPFEFQSWTLTTQPTLAIDNDANRSTTDDQVLMQSFQSEHYSWPTPQEGIFAEIVTLPMPEATSRQNFGNQPYDAAAWIAVNTTGKILLIGKEVRWDTRLHLAYKNKLETQPPAAVIYTYSFDWMSWVPTSFSSIGGRPVSLWGAYYWRLKIPVGCVSYEDGQLIREKLSESNVFAHVTIPAVVELGTHYNVIGMLRGSKNPKKMIIISAHYDTVMDPGFCDNGAGTAGVLELARVFSEAARLNLYRPEYTFVFVTFTGEELGLVGAMNFMLQHQDEIEDIVSVINLDCTGSDLLEVTETFTDNLGLDLAEITLQAARDLGENRVNLIEPGGSDQEAFRNPFETDDSYFLWWGARSEIRSLPRVKSSIMISSFPLFTSDKWSNGTAGWIHTTFDNSTSTETLDWVRPERLEIHTQVAALSAMRFLSAITDPSRMYLYSASLVTLVGVACIIFFKREKAIQLVKKTWRNIHSYVGLREAIFIVILTVLLLFFSFAMYAKIERIEISVNDYLRPATVEYFGAPFRMFGIIQPAAASGQSGESQLDWTLNVQGGLIVVWEGLLMNVALFSLLATVTIYSIMRLKQKHELDKYLTKSAQNETATPEVNQDGRH